MPGFTEVSFGSSKEYLLIFMWVFFFPLYGKQHFRNPFIFLVAKVWQYSLTGGVAWQCLVSYQHCCCLASYQCCFLPDEPYFSPLLSAAVIPSTQINRSGTAAGAVSLSHPGSHSSPGHNIQGSPLHPPQIPLLAAVDSER